MSRLLNPYLSAPAAGRGFPGRNAWAVVVVVAGATVVSGCGSSGGSASSPTSAPAPAPVPTSVGAAPTMPVPTAPAAASSKPAPVQAGRAAGRGRVQLSKAGADYTVVRGDTLSGLAGRFGVKGGWNTLFARNKEVLWNPDLVLVGQQLDIDGK